MTKGDNKMFADITTNESGGFKKTQFTRIKAGAPVKGRILDSKATKTFKHYVPSQRLSIECLFDECPICQNNRRLIEQNPDQKPNTLKGYIPRQTRYSVNFLNRTMVKKNSQGDVIYPAKGGRFPSVDDATGELLDDVVAQPLDQVEVLERGKTLFQQFNSINSTVVNAEGESLGIWNYDITLSAEGSGREMTITVIPHPNENEQVEVDEEDLYDLKEVVIKLTPPEIEKFVRGVSLADIYAARKQEDDEEVSALEGMEEEGSDEIEALFDA
jgi:hypothetical protein